VTFCSESLVLVCDVEAALSVALASSEDLAFDTFVDLSTFESLSDWLAFVKDCSKLPSLSEDALCAAGFADISDFGDVALVVMAGAAAACIVMTPFPKRIFWRFCS
jgi:hypothetical protein